MFYESPPAVVKKTIRCRVKRHFSNHRMSEILPIGYEFDLFVNVTADDECFAPKWHRARTANGLEWKKYQEGRVIPAGRLVNLSFTGADGGTYDTDVLYKCFGINATAGNCFEKLKTTVNYATV